MVGEMIGVAMLQRYFESLRGGNWIGQVPSIRALSVWNIALVNDGACKPEGVLLHPPSLREIIFRAGSMH